MTTQSVFSNNHTTSIDTYIHSIKDDPSTGDRAKLDQHHAKNLPEIEKKAAADAAKNFPDATQVNLSESQIITKYSAMLKSVQARPEGYLQVLLNEKNELEQKIEHSNFYTAAVQIHHAGLRDIKILEDEIDKLNAENTGIKERFEHVCRKFKRSTGKTNGIKKFILQSGYYWAFIVFMSLLDTEYTRAALESFDLNRYAALALAGLVAVVVAGTTHFLGLTLKRKLYVWSMICFLILAPLSVFPAYLRYKHTQQEQTETYIDTDYDYSSGTYDPAAGSDGSNDDGENKPVESPLFWTLTAITIGLIVISVIISWSTHDSEDEFEQNFKDFHKVKPKNERSIVQLNEQINDVKKETDIEIALKQSLITPKDWGDVDVYEEKLGKYNILATHMNSICSQAENLTEDAIMTYRHINSNARNPLNVPAAWKQPPHVEYPKVDSLSNGILILFRIAKNHKS